MDMKVFVENRQKFPSEELDKYRGQYVAWSPDGTTILAGDHDELQLDRRVRAMGYDMADILITMVPSVDTILGGGIEE